MAEWIVTETRMYDFVQTVEAATAEEALEIAQEENNWEQDINWSDCEYTVTNKEDLK